MAYKSFRPSPLPPTPPVDIDPDMLAKLIEANKELSYLEGVSSRIPNIDLFVSMYVRKEALMSSQIEGAVAQLKVVQHFFYPKTEKRVPKNPFSVV